MSRRFSWHQLILIAAIAGTLARPAAAADLTSEAVLRSIDRAQRFLISQQSSNGSWAAREDRYQVGVSSLALLALLNAGMTAEDPVIRKGLEFLRSVKEPEPNMTYEISLMIMALATAKDPNWDDTGRIMLLAQKLERSQISRGQNSGSWSYSATDQLINLGGDRSNAQFAVLGLREAAEAGVPVSRVTWERARRHWVSQQNGDGGWGYSGAHNSSSSGSMTAAGIATLTITERMLREDKEDVNPDGTPNCCRPIETDKPLERGLKWMANHFAVGHNPGGSSWLLYYLYGVERAGRMSGRRFFGDHDWYREGAQFLIGAQNRRTGSWHGVGGSESDPVIATSFALLFLSKGLSPVLINKLKFGPRDPVRADDVLGDDWNHHANDVRNLTELISGLPKWPKLVTWQVIDVAKVVDQGSVADLLQSPILYLSGSEAPELAAEEIELLGEYVNQGGFIFAVNTCQSRGFDQGLRALLPRMLPDGDAQLKPLGAEHPVYRSEYLLDPETVALEGVDYGCRTAIMYCPDDISCLWDKWARHDPPGRPPALKAQITKATQIGINVVAYATGREPPNPLERNPQIAEEGAQDTIERGFLQVAKIRHTGGWDAAPHALRNLLLALNQTVGLTATTQPPELTLSEPTILYPMLYMHGRNRFSLSRQERENLKRYLQRGGVLFADACCGSRQFDDSFRELTDQLFPGRQLERIPPDHEMFTTEVGRDVRRVKRREPEVNDPNAPLKIVVREVEPYFEGIELDGRFAVIYSKYDMSCALERQASVACVGYEAEDALELAVNVVLYALLQEVRFTASAP